MAEDPNVTSAHPISEKVILCVDDDEAILQYEKTLLELSGYAVLTASSGKQALWGEGDKWKSLARTSSTCNLMTCCKASLGNPDSSRG